MTSWLAAPAHLFAVTYAVVWVGSGLGYLLPQLVPNPTGGVALTVTVAFFFGSVFGGFFGLSLLSSGLFSFSFLTSGILLSDTELLHGLSSLQSLGFLCSLLSQSLSFFSLKSQSFFFGLLLLSSFFLFESLAFSFFLLPSLFFFSSLHVQPPPRAAPPHVAALASLVALAVWRHARGVHGGPFKDPSRVRRCAPS